MTDENVNDVNENDKQECCSDAGGGCCDSGSGSDCCSSGSSGGCFKGLLFLVVIVLAGVVVANSMMKGKADVLCGSGGCPDGTVAANACDMDKAAMADKTAVCPTIGKAATADKTAACPTDAAKADAKACCPSDKPAAAAVCPTMVK